MANWKKSLGSHRYWLLPRLLRTLLSSELNAQTITYGNTATYDNAANAHGVRPMIEELLIYFFGIHVLLLLC